jgi:hypothetical protein
MNTGDNGDAVNCSNPIDAAVLADYWLAVLEGPEEQAVEEHLLRCDRCRARLREIMALAEGIRSVVREGSLRMVVSDVFLKRAAEAACASVSTHLRLVAASSAP